jgi:prepilin peptidase CpaA
MRNRTLTHAPTDDKDFTMEIYHLMTHGFLAHALVLALSLLMLAVIVQDAVSYTISNHLNLALLVLYGLAAAFLPVHALMALAAAAIVLAVGMGIFALGVMGGGDIKLLAVLTLWVGWGMPCMQFLFLTALMGGVLAIVLLTLRFVFTPVLTRASPTRSVPRILTRGQPMPYGIAIAIAFLQVLWTNGVPGLHPVHLM